MQKQQQSCSKHITPEPRTVSWKVSQTSQLQAKTTNILLIQISYAAIHHKTARHSATTTLTTVQHIPTLRYVNNNPQNDMEKKREEEVRVRVHLIYILFIQRPLVSRITRNNDRWSSNPAQSLRHHRVRVSAAPHPHPHPARHSIQCLAIARDSSSRR